MTHRITIKRRQQQQALADETRTLIDENRRILATLPHPFKPLAAKGESANDYVNFIWGASGVTGRSRLHHLVTKLLADAGRRQARSQHAQE